MELTGLVVAVLTGVFASLLVWLLVWRVLSPQIFISEEISHITGSLSADVHGDSYRVKLKNMRSPRRASQLSKRLLLSREAMEVSYHATLRFRPRQFPSEESLKSVSANAVSGGARSSMHEARPSARDNWKVVPVVLSSRGRATLCDNAIIGIPPITLEKRYHGAYPNGVITDAPASIATILSILPEASLRITCIASDAFSGSRRAISRRYTATSIGGIGMYFRPMNDQGWWRTRLLVRQGMHPELQLVTKATAEEVLAAFPDEPWC